MARNREKPDAVITSVYLTRSVLAKLDAIAEVQDRSRSWMIESLVAKALGMDEPDEFAQESLGRKGK